MGRHHLRQPVDGVDRVRLLTAQVVVDDRHVLHRPRGFHGPGRRAVRRQGVDRRRLEVAEDLCPDHHPRRIEVVAELEGDRDRRPHLHDVVRYRIARSAAARMNRARCVHRKPEEVVPDQGMLFLR